LEGRKGIDKVEVRTEKDVLIVHHNDKIVSTDDILKIISDLKFKPTIVNLQISDSHELKTEKLDLSQIPEDLKNIFDEGSKNNKIILLDFYSDD